MSIELDKLEQKAWISVKQVRPKKCLRDLALLLKAIFVAVDSDLIEAEQVFLPFLEDSQGMTVSERILPEMHKILQRGGTKNLLPALGETA